MQAYTINTSTYFDIKDIKTNYPNYYKGFRSYSGFLEKKKIKNYIYGILENDEVRVTEKLSKKTGSIYINKNELSEILDNETTNNLPKAPPLIIDSDLVFFKDEEGNEYQVPMRGERTKDKIYFQVKKIAELFQMPNLIKVLQNNHTNYSEMDHYIWYYVSSGTSSRNDMSFGNNVSSISSEIPNNKHVKELYLTYKGLMKVIDTSRSGIGYKFKTWIDEIVFNSLFGTKEAKTNILSKVLNVDADHLKSIMNKSAINISCLYLIDINKNDNNQKIYKYGYTDNITRRFKEHIKTYGDDIKLDTFILIPVLELSKAENEFKKSISNYKYIFEEQNELISLCTESYINVKNIFKTISEKYCGNLKNQISIYENEIKDLKNNYDNEIKDLKYNLNNKISNLKHELELKNKEIEMMKIQFHSDLKDKEIEYLKLKISN